MKKFLFFILFVAILLPATAQESGIRFFHGTWDEFLLTSLPSGAVLA